MEYEQTSGPWFFGRMLDPKDAPAIIGDGDTVVAILPGEWNGCYFIRPDADLIAAAPDLLYSLEALMQKFEARMGDYENVEFHDEWNTAVRAVAKAKGEKG